MVMLIAMGERQLAKVRRDPLFFMQAGRTDSGDAELKVAVNPRGVMRYDLRQSLVSHDQAFQLASAQSQPLGHGYDGVRGLMVLCPGALDIERREEISY